MFFLGAGELQRLVKTGKMQMWRKQPNIHLSWEKGRREMGVVVNVLCPELLTQGKTHLGTF